MVECKICNEICKNYSSLSRHIKKHNFSSKQYYDTFIKSSENEGVCKICKCPTVLYSISYGYRPYCSIKCKNSDKELQQQITNTNISKYNGRGFQSNSLAEKGKKTCEFKYGNENYNNELQRQQTNLEKYGVKNVLQNDSIFREKSEQTKLEKYGDPYYTNIEKTNKTKLQKYNKNGYNNFEKIKQTNLEKYNSEILFENDIIKQKIHNTIYERYNVDWPMQNEMIKEKSIKTFVKNINSHKPKQYTYKYDNYLFDSKPELEYYIWLNDNNISFIYHPDIKLEYYFNNKLHYYLPDFLVNNELHEIKGLHFFKDKNIKNEMCCPFDSTRNELYEAKHQCMLLHNVKIITDFSVFSNYIIMHYGKDYLSQFKI